MNSKSRIYSKIFAHFIKFLADGSLDFTKLNMLITCQLLRIAARLVITTAMNEADTAALARRPLALTRILFCAKMFLSLRAIYKKIN
jgi:hypothetical protein